MTSQKCYFRSAIIRFGFFMPPYRLSLRTSTYCLSAQQVGRRKVGTYTFAITKSEARKNLPGFQILMFCNWVFMVFFLAK